MGLFLDAAYKVLKRAGRPLTAKEITVIAEVEGLLTSGGRTPSQTMKSKLSTDILRNGDRSLFMRSQQAHFALREWLGNVNEHVADRFQKALFDEDIIVFPAKSLLRYVSGVGLHSTVANNQELLEELRPMRRREAEDDQSVIQLVSVFVIRFQNKLLTHKRTRRLPESRLHGFYSVGFGGHLNPDDVPPMFNIFEEKQGTPWLLRELQEEIKFPSQVSKHLTYRGLLYDDSREVSRQHLGIVYEVSVSSPEFTIGERGFLMDAKYEALSEIKDRLYEFENWSVLLIRTLEGVWRSTPVEG